MTRLLFALLLAAFAQYVNAAADVTGVWDAEVSYADEKVMSSRFSEGNSVVILPIIKDRKFDTLRGDFVRKAATSLEKTQNAFKPLTIVDLEKSWNRLNPGQPIDSFLYPLLTDDILKLSSLDHAWEALPAHYLLVTRLLGGVAIAGTESRYKRRATISVDIWDATTQSVVWRGTASGYEMDRRVSDADFILKGLKALYLKLPPVFPVVNEERW